MVDKQAKNLYLPRYWLSWLGVSFIWLFSKFPYSWQLKIGRGIGLLAYKLVRSRRRIALRNIQACFPSLSAEEQVRLLRRHFVFLGQGVVTAGIAWWSNARRLRRLIVSVRGLENLEAAFAKGKGVILLSAHFTSVEVCGQLVSLLTDRPLNVMIRSQSSEVFENVLQQGRKNYVKKLILRANVREMLRCLKKNEGVFYLPDQNFEQEHSMFVPFMGVNTLTLTTTARFVKITDCSVIPVYYFQREDGKGYDLEFFSALENYPSDNVYNDTLLINQIFEKAIRQHPEQYFWVHRRFKVRPEGEPSFYD